MAMQKVWVSVLDDLKVPPITECDWARSVCNGAGDRWVRGVPWQCGVCRGRGEPSCRNQPMRRVNWPGKMAMKQFMLRRLGHWVGPFVRNCLNVVVW